MEAGMVRATAVSRTLDRVQSVKDACHVINDVRELRLEADLSQAALAAALGVSRQTINAIETGRYDPSLPLAFALSRYFHRTIEEIFHAY
jgi:putative transcriptional regulator